MTRVAVIADSHADLRATEAVLDAIAAAGIERVWCLGDFCSGGPEPLVCFERTLEACEVVLAGNHELFVVHRVWETIRAWWALAAQRAAEQLGPERVAQLADLPSHALRPQAELVHGALTDPAHDFVTGPREAQSNLDLLNRPLLLFGHTHEPACWAPELTGEWAREEPVTVGIEYPLPDPESPHSSRLLNPGAVCDPDGARWLELRLDEHPSVAVWHQEAIRGGSDG